MTRVLVVDDKDENLHYLEALLSAAGCLVETAHHGAEALVRARREPPDLIVSDLLMPVMDGYTLLRHWKSDARLAGIPFIVYTATYTEPEDEHLAFDLGADAFILKPAEPDVFLEHLRRVTAKGLAAMPALPLVSVDDDERETLRKYSETLIRKLEEKTIELEGLNRALVADLAARERAEVALRESEARLRVLTEVMPQLVWMADAKGQFDFVNQRVCDYTGLASEECLGDRFWRIVHLDDRQVVLGAWRAVVETGASYSVEARLRAADGTYRWWLIRGLSSCDARGEIVKWFGTCTDIDELKEAAVRLRRAEEQLRQSQKMEAVGRLAGGVAHDFNNMLSVILSYTSLVLDELEPGNALRLDIEEVRRAGQRASDLTQQLLAFSRRQMLKPQRLELGEVVRAMQSMLERLLGEDVSLSIATTEGEGFVDADPTQLEQIILNLAVNARDAMPDGGLLTIEAKPVDFEGDDDGEHRGMIAGAFVLLSVTDTGHGMDEETRERVFEPFFTTKEKGKGTGLGLATVFGIVAQSQGHVFVYSEPGLGTTFKIYLPRVEGSSLVRARTVTPPSTSRRGTETVLLVEDEPQLRAVNAAILRRHGYHVLDAQNGGEAFLLAERYPARIHLLLTDVVMPRMSGRALADRLRPMRPDMKVLFVSGYTEHAIVHHGVLEPGIEFLPKPTTPDTLLRKLREVLDGEITD